jgi:hypothetical protein
LFCYRGDLLEYLISFHICLWERVSGEGMWCNTESLKGSSLESHTADNHVIPIKFFHFERRIFDFEDSLFTHSNISIAFVDDYRQWSL